MYLCHFLIPVDSTKPFTSRSRVSLLSTSAHFSRKGDSIFILIPSFNERSRTTQGETPLLPAVVGPHKIRRQHSLMLRWVLLCDYCSYFFHLPKTSERGRAINAHIIIAAYYSDHCSLFRVCSFAELSSAFIITAPAGTAVVYTTFPSSFFQSYITRAWGMPASFVHSCIFFSLHVSQKVEILVPFLSNGSLRMVPLLLSLTTTFSVEETLMDFGYTYAPNLIHQGASVITEISSAHGDKNSTSSKQQ
jgi:hypothetical protein